MTPLTQTCRVTGQPFVITDEDQAFYSKMGVPLPSMNPIERIRRRLSFRNERKLYHRKCDLCKKEIVAMYPSDSPYTVYCQSCWWSDDWDASEYRQEIDFNRPFFDQFAELMKKVPRISLMNKEHENAEYGNFTWRNKNSYMLTTCGECQDSFYTKRSWFCKDTCDGSNMGNSELSYESLDSLNCYNCAWIQTSADCSDCTLGYNLKNCQNCFACFNLTNKKFCINNEQYTQEEYEKKVVELRKNLPQEVEKFIARQDIPRKFMNEANNENCSGDSVYNSKNAFYCFDASKLQDCKFVIDATNNRDCYDFNNGDNSELVYDSIGMEGNYMMRFTDICWFDKFIDYSSLCFNSEYLFGCVGMRKGKYSIFNKNYTKEDFEKLRDQLIDHMKKTGEWGEFFPTTMSPFAYNESVAQDHYPLSKEQVEAAGLRWLDEKEDLAYQGPKLSPPLWARDAGDEVTKTIYTCIVSGKLYKITPQELKLYKTMDLPLPQKAPEQRFQERMRRKNPRVLWVRSCSDCGTAMETAYSPNRPEKIMCENCYLKMMY